MALYKRGKTWWIRVKTPNGKLIRLSTKTSNRLQAQEYHDKVQSERWRFETLRRQPKKTWNDAAN